MPYPLTPGLEIETSRPRTAVGYLIEIQTESSMLRWSTYGDVEWAGYFWTKKGVEVGKIRRGDSSRAETTLRVGNGDGVIGAYVLAERLAGKTARVWLYYGGSANEGKQEFDGVISDVVFADPPKDEVTISLVTPEGGFLRSPREPISAATGFKTLLPKGTKLTFHNGQTFVLDR